MIAGTNRRVIQDGLSTHPSLINNTHPPGLAALDSGSFFKPSGCGEEVRLTPTRKGSGVTRTPGGGRSPGGPENRGQKYGVFGKVSPLAAAETIRGYPPLPGGKGQGISPDPPTHPRPLHPPGGLGGGSTDLKKNPDWTPLS